MSSDAILLEDAFTITSLDAGKYDRVARLTANNASSSAAADDEGPSHLTLDINTEIYPVAVGDNITLCLASTLAPDGAKDDGKMWRGIARGESTLADHYEYVCHGKVYSFREGEGERLQAFVSFGGLLLFLEGPYKKLQPLKIDYVYLLVRKS